MAEESLDKLRIDKTRAGAGRPHRRRPTLWFFAILGVVLLLGLAATGVFTPAVEVETATVSQVYPSQTFTLLNASGYVVPQRKASVAAKMTAQLVWLGVEEGSVVHAGQVIARLEDRDLKAARNQAEANLKAARAQVAQARAELHDARLNFGRQEQLLAGGFIAQGDFDQAQARLLKDRAGLAAARSARGAAAAALKAAEVNLDYTLIRAPFDGVVLTKDADVGDIVTPIGAAASAKAAVVTIADMRSLQVEADVSESNLEKVRLGQPCEIHLDALPDERFEGAVHMIVPTADRTKATVMVKVRFRKLDPRILPEMSARVAFLRHPVAPDEKKPRIAVAKDAVILHGERRLVYRVEGHRAVATPVTTGMELGDMVAIPSGLTVGEKVVLKPAGRIKNGTRVKVEAP
jgi:RND family efflux transporter MFP subunit